MAIMTTEELQAFIAQTSINIDKISDSYQEIRDMQEENTEQQKENAEQQKENAEQQKKTDEQMKKTDEQMKKTDIKIKELGKNIGGIANSMGDDAEEFFYSSLLNKQQLGKIIFNDITPNILKKRNGNTIEIDVFMTNGDSVGLVEVKQNFKQKDFKQIDNSVKKFHEFYPQYKGMKVYGAIAGKVITPKIEKQALKKGYFVLKQQGNHIETISPL